MSWTSGLPRQVQTKIHSLAFGLTLGIGSQVIQPTCIASGG